MFIPHQGNLSLQQTQVPRNTNNRCRISAPHPSGQSHRTFPYLRLRDNVEEGWKDCESRQVEVGGRAVGVTVRECLLEMLQATPIKSHQHYCCPEVNWTVAISADMPRWTGKSPWGLNLTHITTGNWGWLGRGGEVFLREEHTNCCQVLSLE